MIYKINKWFIIVCYNRKLFTLSSLIGLVIYSIWWIYYYSIDTFIWYVFHKRKAVSVPQFYIFHFLIFLFVRQAGLEPATVYSLLILDLYRSPV